MPGGRPTTPLFDLLSRGQTAAPSARPTIEPEVAPRPSKPTVRVELKPREMEAPPPPPRPKAPRIPMPSNKWLAALMGGSTVRMPVNAVYFATAGVVILMLFAWLGGQKWGAAKERKDFEAFHSREAPIINEPLDSTPASLTSNTQPKTAANTDPKSGTKPPTTPLPTPGSGTLASKQTPSVAIDPATAVITSKGLLAGDPREAELNYLNLATLPKADSESAIAFLASNGVEAFAVPVDPTDSGAKNPAPSKYRLWVLPGITTEDYRQRKTVRTRLEAEVSRLGQIWRKEHRGTSDFSQPLWEKFRG
jgi:hypothetical protein